MNKRGVLRLVVGCSTAAVLVAVGWLVLPKARAAPTGEAAPTAAAVSHQDAVATEAPAARVLSEQERLIQELVSLMEEFDAYATQPGWTLLRFEQTELLPTTGPKPLPPRYRGEYWHHFNEKRQAFEGVYYVIAPELGRVLMGYELHGEWVSLWNGVRGLQQPYTPSFSLSLARTLTDVAAGEGSFELSSRETTLRGRAVRVVELRLPYSAEALKYPVAGLDKPAWGIYEVFYLDSATGMVLRCEHYYVLEDMTLVPGGIVEQKLIAANVEPPAEVLGVLARATTERAEP